MSKYTLSNKKELFLSPNRPILHTTKYEEAAAPMLPKAIELCGESNIKVWIADHLYALCELSLAKEKLAYETKIDLAEVIVSKMAGCNVAEVLLFFYKAVVGDFEKIYKASTSEIGALVNKYLVWLRAEKVRLENEQEPIYRAKRYDEQIKDLQESNRLMGENKIAWAQRMIAERNKKNIQL